MHLKQSGFTYSAYGAFIKKKERIEKFMQTGHTDFIYKNELDKAYFQDDLAYSKSKDLVKRMQTDKFLRDKAFKIANKPKYDGYQRGLALMAYKFFDKKSKRKVYSSFRDNIWGVDLADMQPLNNIRKESIIFCVQLICLLKMLRLLL